MVCLECRCKMIPRYVSEKKAVWMCPDCGFEQNYGFWERNEYM